MITALVVLGLVIGTRVRTLVGSRRRLLRRSAPPDDVALLGDLALLGLLAGMTFPAALAASAAHVAPGLAEEIHRVGRIARMEGSAAAFVRAGAPLDRLLTLAARAAITGAPMTAAVAAFTAEVRNAARARAIERARRLSVRLLFPLALLILPGFVLLVAGPFVLEGLARLEI
jgi:tight adherence protein C